jgi:hypothetical protein
MSYYSVIAADLVPGLLPQTEYDRCLANPPGGTPAALESIVTQAEGELHAHTGGAPVGATLAATFRPLVLTCVLYRLHARRCQQDNAQIPATVQADFERALAWADDRGRKLIDNERAAAGSGIAVVAGQDPLFTRDSLRGF